MKHKGSYFEYEAERNRDLLRAYRELLLQPNVDKDTLFERLVEMPSVRYWVSEERAYHVISSMIWDKPLPKMKPNKRAMYDDILEEVLRLNAIREHSSLYDLVFEVVNSPAPRFYLTPKSARVIIYKIRSGWYQSRKKK